MAIASLKCGLGKIMTETAKERFFSVELKSKVNLKNVTVTNSDLENVLIEGNIGSLQHAVFIEGVVLEVLGDKGIIRINLNPDEIKQKPNPQIEVNKK